MLEEQEEVSAEMDDVLDENNNTEEDIPESKMSEVAPTPQGIQPPRSSNSVEEKQVVGCESDIVLSQINTNELAAPENDQQSEVQLVQKNIIKKGTKGL